MKKVKVFEASAPQLLETFINEFVEETGAKIVGTVPFQLKTMKHGGIYSYAMVTYEEANNGSN